MANRIYIRKIDDHCVNKEISFTAEVHKKVFLDQTEFDIVGKRSGVTGKVTVGMATDRRFNGDIKNVIKAELGSRPLTSGDILIMRTEGKNLYSVEMFSDTDPEYVIFDEMCGDDRHTIIAASKTGPKSKIEVYQLIKYGVPGTGKSHGITEKIKETYDDYDESGDCEFVFRTTLHPEYSYYDFVGSTYPVIKDDKSITYDFKPGIFTLALAKAVHPDNKYQKVFLVLEEMSRANVAAVFGDLFQLLDRDDEGVSEYKIRNDLIAEYIREKTGVDLSNNNIYLPSNLYIYGTVNTSDQNVFVMDNAFKRRFEFEYVGTEPVSEDETHYKNDYEFMLETTRYKWTDFYQRFNAYVTGIMGLREDKQIGPFFVKFKQGDETDVEEYNYNQIKNKLLQYMWEDVHKCAMAERPLFREGIDTFGEAYSRINSHENVFCDEFCDTFIVTGENTEPTAGQEDGEVDATTDTDN